MRTAGRNGRGAYKTRVEAESSKGVRHGHAVVVGQFEERRIKPAAERETSEIRGPVSDPFFLAETDEFILDRGPEKFLLTYAPGGFLKRIRASKV